MMRSKMILYSYELPNKSKFYTYENIFDKKTLSSFLTTLKIAPLKDFVTVSIVEVKKGDKFIHSTFMFNATLARVNE